ncbi:helix-turn-helix domain-containing protein [Grimontia sp. NTOU-MAR1]|uniref:helix-turn-helix domain-containing protein n=1 Tax=Grimontia sp. NTOU-MAR1 TaxID=3111011 RepID=UPI002DBABCA9|nr:helix-turn-helix domain-containing protein [Grimontia sp. NTOU-MAR1]WRV96495.1 helix-turn-helix domain-containing protein [Grimontia sp. NTOU-MAR1]
MGRLKAKIPPFDYLRGKDIVDKLKEVSGVDIDLQLADVYGVPKGTIGTWKQRDLVPYELVIRACIATGANIEYLALGKGESFSLKSEYSPSEILSAKRISSGKIEEMKSVSLDRAFLTEGLTRENCFALFSEEATYLINSSETSPISGFYLIDVDGVFSINKVRRLPGKKLSVDFDGSLVDVGEDDIKVIGRVAMSMAKA